MVNFFKGFRIFANLRASTMERIFLYMRLKNFIRGQKIFQQDVTSVDGIYFIVKGDFEITKLVGFEKT